MEARKLLYVTDLKEKSLTLNLLKGILPVHKLDFSEIAFLQTSSFNSWLKGLSDFSIKSKIILDDPLLPHGILNTAKNEGVSLIVVNLDRKKGKTSKNSMVRQLIRSSSLYLLVWIINKKDRK